MTQNHGSSKYRTAGLPKMMQRISSNLTVDSKYSAHFGDEVSAIFVRSAKMERSKIRGGGNSAAGEIAGECR